MEEEEGRNIEGGESKYRSWAYMYMYQCPEKKKKEERGYKHPMMTVGRDKIGCGGDCGWLERSGVLVLKAVSAILSFFIPRWGLGGRPSRSSFCTGGITPALVHGNQSVDQR